jgi:hypothetical protein
MPALTRRRYPERADCWHVYYGDGALDAVHVGTVARRTGNPNDTDPWEWACGFYPGSHPGEHRHGTAATFDQARADFEEAWQVFLANRTEADFQEWNLQNRQNRKAAQARLRRRKSRFGFGFGARCGSTLWASRYLASIRSKLP